MKEKCLILVLGLFVLFQVPVTGQTSIVEKYGQLSVKGKYIVSEHGDTVQLRGMSFFWSQWQGSYYNASAVKWLRDDWKCTVVRAAMGVENGGYMDNPFDEKDKVMRVVKAAIDLGMYVIIDYHSHLAHTNPEWAKKFFADMAQRFGKYPNVLYEIYNEPLQDPAWSTELKPYAEEVIKAIRQHDPDNIIIVGTRRWSQLVSEAAEDPVSDPNVAYTLHFYAASHGQDLRDEAQKALDKGVCLFVTEFGTCDYSGNGKLDFEATRVWWDFLDRNKISWCNWAISDKEESASALTFGASWTGKWKENRLSPSGKFVREEIVLKNTPVLGVPVKTE